MYMYYIINCIGYYYCMIMYYCYGIMLYKYVFTLIFYEAFESGWCSVTDLRNSFFLPWIIAD